MLSVYDFRYVVQKVIHRDPKPENILSDMKGDRKIFNFGWSVDGPFRLVIRVSYPYPYLSDPQLFRGRIAR